MTTVETTAEEKMMKSSSRVEDCFPIVPVLTRYQEHCSRSSTATISAPTRPFPEQSIAVTPKEKIRNGSKALSSTTFVALQTYRFKGMHERLSHHPSDGPSNERLGSDRLAAARGRCRRALQLCAAVLHFFSSIRGRE